MVSKAATTAPGDSRSRRQLFVAEERGVAGASPTDIHGFVRGVQIKAPTVSPPPEDGSTRPLARGPAVGPVLSW